MAKLNILGDSVTNPVSNFSGNLNVIATENQPESSKQEEIQNPLDASDNIARRAISLPLQTDFHFHLQRGNTLEAKNAFLKVPESLKSTYLQNEDQEGRTALYWIVKCDNDQLFEQVLQYCPKTVWFHQDRKGDSPFHWVVRFDDEEKAVLRLKKIFDSLSLEQKIMLCKIKDEKGNTVFHWAAQRAKIFQALMQEFDEDYLLLFLQDLNNDGFSPLHIAVALLDTNKAIKVVDVILSNLSFASRKKVINFLNNDRQTPLHLAVRLENIIAAILLTFKMINALSLGDRFESLNCLDSQNRSVFHWAAFHEGLFFLLLQTLTPVQKKNALSMQDSNKSTPMDWLKAHRRERNLKILSLLQNKNNANGSTKDELDEIQTFLDNFLPFLNIREFQRLLVQQMRRRRLRLSRVRKQTKKHTRLF